MRGNDVNFFEQAPAFPRDTPLGEPPARVNGLYDPGYDAALERDARVDEEPAGPEEEKAPKPDDGRIFPLEYFGDIKAVTDAQDFVEGLLVESTMSVIYGESNSGKTFFATDLAFHIAAGWEWNGRAVTRGAVLYCALEDGGHGIRNRLAALREHHAISDGSVVPPLAIVPVTMNLLDPEQDISALVRTIKHVAEKLEIPVKAVVVGTLSPGHGRQR